MPKTPPWSVYTHHMDDPSDHNTPIIQGHTRHDVIAWLQARGYLDAISQEDSAPLYITRTDIPKYLYTPHDVVVLKGQYALQHSMALTKDDQATLPRIFLNSISSHTATNQHRIIWIHQTPPDWPISFRIVRYYDQMIEGQTITLNAEANMFIDLCVKQPGTHPLHPHAGIYGICIRRMHLNGMQGIDITSVHAMIQKTLMEKTSDTRLSISHHVLLQCIRSIPTVIDPDLFSIIAPSYTID